jgi:hypothetical protein
MSRRIPNHLRLIVADRAGYRCEYCHVPELFLATTFHIDHIRSQKHGGKTNLDNLSFCCPHCNQNKGSDIATYRDDETDDLIRLFNPRKDVWGEHFIIKDGLISPASKIGEATIRILQFNLPERVLLRAELRRAGYY